MRREHHRLNGHEFEETPGDSEGQGSLGCSSPWSSKESDTTERLNTNIFKRRGRQRSAQVRELIVSSYIPGGQVKVGGYSDHDSFFLEPQEDLNPKGMGQGQQRNPAS